MSVPLLDLVAQYNSIRDEIEPALRSVIERQAFIMGPEIPALEQAVAALSHVRHAIACASGTDALLLPLRALDLEPGDQVIAPAFTFFATAGAIHNAGGTPVFVDVDAATFKRAAGSDRGPRSRRVPARSSWCTCSGRWHRWSASSRLRRSMAWRSSRMERSRLVPGA
jgi:hypothetical protein